MTKEEFIISRANWRRQAKSTLVWFLAMVFFACCCGILFLIGCLCCFPLGQLLPEDRATIVVREVLLLILVASIAGGILLADRVWSRKSGFICRFCNKWLDSKVEETGRCGHCDVRVFDP